MFTTRRTTILWRWAAAGWLLGTCSAYAGDVGGLPAASARGQAGSGSVGLGPRELKFAARGADTSAYPLGTHPQDVGATLENRPVTEGTAPSEHRQDAGPTGEDKPTTETKPAAPAAPSAEGAPAVVEVFPKPGDEEVDPITDIRIRFDRPMDPARLSLRWKEGFYMPRESWRYLPETNEFIVPVLHKPFETQRIEVNPRTEGLVPNGFRSPQGVVAERFEWTFKTKRDFDNEEAPVPQVIAIDPPDGSIVGGVTPVVITFDQPMDPDHLHGIGRQLSGEEYTGQPYFHVRYVEDKNQFVIPLSLPARWSGELVFEGFRGAGHRHAAPLRVTYTTSAEVFSEKHQQQLEVAGRSPELRRVLEQVANSRGGIHTLSERVRATRHSMSETGIYTTMLSGEGIFRMDGLQKFYGNVSSMMNTPFIVASNGEQCWCLSETEGSLQLVTVPYDEVATKNVLIGDPFHSTRADMVTAIQHMQIEYLGTGVLGDRQCHVIQGWWATVRDGNLSANVTRWWIDGTSFLPSQVVRDWGSSVRVEQLFTFESINEPLPPVYFMPPRGPTMKQVPPAPLDVGYDSRFLDVIDPAIGQMSVRWGQQGPAGTVATGLR